MVSTLSFLSKLAPYREVDGRKIRLWNQLIFVGVIYAGYEYTSSLASGSKSTAQANALTEVHIEKFFHIFNEQRIQSFVVQHAIWLIKLADLYYTTVHFILPVVVFALLFGRYARRYIVWRNTMILLNLIALVVFILLPVMPPRLLPHAYGFVDTQSVYGGAGSLDATLMKDAGNLYAAMPSLHMAWALWCTFSIVAAVRNRLGKVLLLLHPLITIFVVVVTANHFWLDIVAGFVDFYIAYFISGGRRLEFWNERGTFSEINALEQNYL